MTDGTLSEEQIDRTFAMVVREAEADYAVFVREMEHAIRSEVPELEAVPTLARQFGQLCTEHTHAIGDLMGSSQIEDLDQTTPGATKFARDCAHWDIPATTILRILQRGADLAWHWWTARINEHVPDPELRAAVSTRCGHLMMSHVSAGVSLAVAVHNEEREFRVRGVSWKQRELVMGILGGGEAQPARALSRRLGYDLDGWHVAFVVWLVGDEEEDLIALEASTRAWANAACQQTPLLVPVDNRSIWGWLRSTSPPDWVTDDLPLPGDGARVAIGQPAAGLQGFRDSHAEAIQTWTLAGRVPAGGPVLRHRELATVAMISDDIEHLRRYVARALGGLGEATERAERLRSTVRAYVKHGENVRDAAEAMHFHRNTVQGRLALAAEVRGRPLEEDRLGLALALEITDVLGVEVFGPSAPEDPRAADSLP